MLDALPSGRNFRSIGTLVTAVRPQRQNMGDSNPWAQTIAVRGMGTNGTVILIDGLSSELQCRPASRPIPTMRRFKEISYQTSANTADVSYGGLRANMVPRDGGNAFHGGAFVSFLEGQWQANNLTPELEARGLRVANRVVFTRDYNPSVSEPVKQDRIWFLAVRFDACRFIRKLLMHSKDGRPG